MKSKIPLIFLCALLVVIAVSSAVFYFKFSAKSPVVIPFFAPSPTQSLASALEHASLQLNSPPKIFSSSLTASVSGFSVIFSKDKDFALQVRALQLVLPRLKMDNRVPKLIDVRLVNKVIIKY